MNVKNKVVEFELFFDDLNKEAKKRFLNACGLNEKDVNEEFPIACFVVEGLK